jgi:CBS domain-containing protein
MTKANTGSVLIMEPNGELLGILTERDLMTRVVSKPLNPELTRVTEVMTPKPHCITPEMTVSNAVLIMIERGFRHLPITSSNGKVLGVFSVRDALPKEIGEAISLSEFLDQAGNTLA